MKNYNEGSALIHDIKNTVIPSNFVGIWYLGQEGILIKHVDKYIMVDPYLTPCVEDYKNPEKTSEERNYLSPLNPMMLDFIDIVICTHNHMDHMDPKTLSAISNKNSKTKFICPQPNVEYMKSFLSKESQVIGALSKIIIEIDGVKITPIAAMHEVFHQDENGDFCELSFCLEIEGFTFFHGGDMRIYDELVIFLKDKKIDVGLIPINGRDRKRNKQGIVGNCSFREAADLSAEVAFDMIIPMHFDLFDVNKENPAYFVDYVYHQYHGQKFHVFMPGEKYIYSK